MESVQTPNLSPTELVDVFPEAKDAYILPRLKALDALISEREYSIKQSLYEAKMQEDPWFVREVIKAFELPDLIELKQERRRLMRYLPAPTKPGSSHVDADDIRHAKDRSIVELADRLIPSLKKCGRLYRALCPFHDESTSSFYLYPTTNHYHCFGCGAHGDVISLVQKLHGHTFVEAVKNLLSPL